MWKFSHPETNNDFRNFDECFENLETIDVEGTFFPYDKVSHLLTSTLPLQVLASFLVNIFHLSCLIVGLAFLREIRVKTNDTRFE